MQTRTATCQVEERAEGSRQRHIIGTDQPAAAKELQRRHRARSLAGRPLPQHLPPLLPPLPGCASQLMPGFAALQAELVAMLVYKGVQSQEPGRDDLPDHIPALLRCG